MAERAAQLRKYEAAVVGGGSAATGLFAAVESQQPGSLERFAGKKGVAWIADAIGAGRLATYRIHGNSDPVDFVSGTPQEGLFAQIRGSNRAKRLERKEGRVHLADEVAPFLEERATVVKKLLESSPASDVLEGEVATRIDLRRFGRRVVTIESGDRIQAKHVVLATGGKERILPDFQQAFADKYLLSGQVITEEAIDQVRQVVASGGKIAFVAASHSTYAAIAKILDDPKMSVADRQIVVVSKKEPLVFFANEQEAQQAGYVYQADQVCPKTGRINRFGGLRNDAKDVVLRNDPRVAFEKVAIISSDQQVFQDADLIISGIGYDTNIVPIFDRKGNPIEIRSKQDGQVEVDSKGRIRDVNGKRIRRVYGTGLGYGPRPTDLGGEPAFSGKLDGVNVQDEISGPEIAKQVFGRG